MEKRRKKQRNIRKSIIVFLVVITALLQAAKEELVVYATTIEGIKGQIEEDQNHLTRINDRISSLEDEQDLIEEQIADLNSEILNMMTSIQLKESEISSKEDAITLKQTEIEQAQKEYEAARERERQQYENMKACVRFMYENSNTKLFTAFLDGSSFGELLNRADYVEKVYEYSKKVLDDYETAKNEVQALWDQLEADKAQLQNEKTQLEADRASLQTLKVQLDNNLAVKKRESANYDADIAKLKQDAAAKAKKIQQEKNQLKKLEEQKRRQAEVAAVVNGNFADTGYASVIESASGSELGKKVAKFACQYIGNPYVWGGTSLTNGADCSGFVYSVYKSFGYSLPRTSYEQRSAGTGVSYSEAQPGDLICYDGHIGIYIGGGMLVHASNPKSGIKVNNAGYRKILAVRRIV